MMSWRPQKEFLEALVTMGISACAAEKGLYYTGNTSVDAAASWVIDHNSDPDLNEPMQRESATIAPERKNSISEGPNDALQVKMVFVVNDQAGMGRGKIAAQVAHAAIGLYQVLMQNREKYGGMLKEWEQFGCTKIVLRASSGPHVMDIEEEGRIHGIPKFLVCDVGKTQVAAGNYYCGWFIWICVFS